MTTTRPGDQLLETMLKDFTRFESELRSKRARLAHAARRERIAKAKSTDRAVVLYARARGPEGAGAEVASAEAQLRRLRSWAADSGTRVAAEYVDLGVGANEKVKPAFSKMLNEVTDGTHDVGIVAVTSLTRLSRNIGALVKTRAKLGRRGISIETIESADEET